MRANKQPVFTPSYGDDHQVSGEQPRTQQTSRLHPHAHQGQWTHAHQGQAGLRHVRHVRGVLEEGVPRAAGVGHVRLMENGIQPSPCGGGHLPPLHRLRRWAPPHHSYVARASFTSCLPQWLPARRRRVCPYLPPPKPKRHQGGWPDVRSVATRRTAVPPTPPTPGSTYPSPLCSAAGHAETHETCTRYLDHAANMLSRRCNNMHIHIP